MRLPEPSPVALVLLAMSLLGCGPVDGRRAWLVEQLTRDNAPWLTRDPELLAGKYRAMAADPYDYMRGTAAIFLADLGRPGTDRTPTAFVDARRGADLLLLGDPHPENFGVMLPAGGDPERDLYLEMQDLDGAAHGPWIWDLRRAAVGLSMLLHPAEAVCPPASCRDAAVAALAHGYVDEIEALADTGRGWVDPTSRHDHGGLIRDFLDDTRQDGLAQRRLFKETDPHPEREGERVLERDEALDEEGDGLLEPTPAQQAQLDVLLHQLAPSMPAGFRVLDAVRHHGRGVASFPATRFAVLWDTGAPGTDDDGLLTLREVLDPPAVPGLWLPVEGLFADGASRVPAASRQLWRVPTADPHLAGLSDGPLPFKVQTWSYHHDGLDHEDLVDALLDGDHGVEDVLGLSRLLGGLIAGAHARSRTATGEPAFEDVAFWVVGAGEALAEETVEAARRDLTRTLDDHELFTEALDDLGPWLGAETYLLDGGAL